MSTGERLADALLEQGAEAVAVVGSRATGDATDDSDLDLAVIGEGPQYRLEIHDGTLVSVGWAPAEEQVRRLYDPRWLGTHVPGWRHAVVLRDPEVKAAKVKDLALNWDWSSVASECDEWAAETVTAFAEEALKLIASLRAGDVLTAAFSARFWRSDCPPPWRFTAAFTMGARTSCGNSSRMSSALRGVRHKVPPSDSMATTSIPAADPRFVSSSWP